MTVKLVVPTRNRPRHVGDLLAYLAHFYPGTQIIVADGSDNKLKPAVREACESMAGALDVTFQPYPEEMPLFARLLACIQNTDDEYLALTADDDYPLMDTYASALGMLSKSNAFCTIATLDVVLKHEEDRSFSARISPVRPLLDETAAKRVEQFSRWRFATSYGVSRRETLIARYAALSETYCAGFIDFQVGVEDCLQGKVGVIGELGCIRTHSYRGSYLRPTQPLVFLRKSEQVMAIVEHTTRRLIQVDNLDEATALRTAQNAMTRQIASLVGGGPKTKRGFTKSATFLKPIVQKQYKIFYELFENGTKTRKAHLDKLNFVRDRLLAQSHDLPPEGDGNYEDI